MTWTDKISAALSRLGAPAMLPAFIPGQLDVPYYRYEDVEASLLEITQQKLREIPVDQLDPIGSVAFVIDEYTDGTDVPQNAIRLINAAIKPYPDSTEYEQSVFIDPARFRQIELLGVGPPAYITCYTLIDGKFYFLGDKASVVWLVEPSLDDARNDLPILPSAYDDELVDWVVRQMLLTNSMVEVNQ